MKRAIRDVEIEMSTYADTQVRVVDDHQALSPSEGQERFAERRRIVLMEPDRALRSVLVRTLARLGCIVSIARSPERFIEALQDDILNGAVIALDADTPWAARLHAANPHQVPIVVLCDSPSAPHRTEQWPTVRCLQKPFDMRDLLAHLRLPEKAKIIGAG